MRHASEIEGAIGLHPKRDDVTAYNYKEFKILPGPTIRYKHLNCYRHGTTQPQYNGRGVHRADGILEVLGPQFLYERWAKLKVGMPVLLLINLGV